MSDMNLDCNRRGVKSKLNILVTNFFYKKILIFIMNSD